MGLFDKKFCDFCGNKIGLLGNKKLEDANMCKDCASKLSPWFSERRHSTKADIEKQLQYREQNKSAVAAFHASRTLGTASTKLIIDDNARKFMVTSAKDINAANPDVLDFSQALGCDLDVKEHRNEIRRTDSNGKSVSYNPPRYKYSYEFHAIIRVNHPYFDEMRFALSSGSIEVGEQPMNPGQSGGWSVSRSGFNILGNKIDEYYKCVDCGNEIKAAVDAMKSSGGSAASGEEEFLQSLKKQADELRAQLEAQRAQGNPDPTLLTQYMQVQQQIALIYASRQQGAFGGTNLAMGAAGMGAGQMGAAGMGAAGMGSAGMHAIGAGMLAQHGLQQMPQQAPQQGGGQPMQQGFQQMPQQGGMAPGMTVTCPACQATTKLGAAGICTYCGTKIV